MATSSVTATRDDAAHRWPTHALAADLFSLQGLRNLGPTVRGWRHDWRTLQERAKVTFPLPAGLIEPVGYVVLQHAVRLDRPEVAGYLERGENGEGTGENGSVRGSGSGEGIGESGSVRGSGSGEGAAGFTAPGR
jgi:hypothetical protein